MKIKIRQIKKWKDDDGNTVMIVHWTDEKRMMHCDQLRGTAAQVVETLVALELSGVWPG